MTIQPREPVYEQVANAIRADIREGVYAPGTRLPAEKDLAARFGVSSTTVKLAMNTLRAEGLITSRQGRPATVTESPSLVWQDNLVATADGFYTMLERAGARPATITTVDRGPAPEHVADALGIETGTEVVIRHRVMRAEGGPPLCIAVSYFPVDVVSAAPALEDATQHGMPTHLRNAFGLTWSVDLCDARRATDLEAQMLQIEPGSPVAIRKGQTLDQQGRILHYIDVVTAPGRLPAHFTTGPVPDESAGPGAGS